MIEQRNSYKGHPLRAWLKLGFLDRDGNQIDMDLLVDTGSSHGVVIRKELFEKLVLRTTRRIRTNFGEMQGGWIRLRSTELGLVEMIEGFGSDDMARSAMRSSLDFAGVVGLPVLQMMEYGGNFGSFWIRTPS